MKPLVSVGITTPVAVNLLVPELRRSALGGPVVLCAAVPEAAVQKHRHPSSSEDEIRRAGYLPERPDVHPVPEAKRVDGRSQRELGPCVATSVRPHNSTGGLTGSPGSSHSYHRPGLVLPI